MNRMDSLLRKLQATKFSMIEMHLYLDTHPEDLGMLAAYQKYASKYALLLNEYEEKHGSLDWLNAQGVEWFKNPWPWDGEVCD